MNASEKESAVKISRVLRAARKQRGYSQQEVSSMLGISQGGLSKLEHGVMIPSATLWFSFCRLTSIPTDSLVRGYIERNHLAHLDTSNREGLFRMNDRYAHHRGSKVKALLPFLNYAREKLGDRKLTEYFKSIDVDPDYFYDLDHQINIGLCLDLSRMLIEKNLLDQKGLNRLVSQASAPEVHGNLHSHYSSAENETSLMGLLITNARQYECNFTYRIENQKKNVFEFSVEPEPHLEKFDYRNDSSLGDFLCRYKKGYFKSFAQYGNRVSGPGLITLDEVECHYHGADKCTYRMKFAA